LYLHRASLNLEAQTFKWPILKLYLLIARVSIELQNTIKNNSQRKVFLLLHILIKLLKLANYLTLRIVILLFGRKEKDYFMWEDKELQKD
jgi:hypothetical protein